MSKSYKKFLYEPGGLYETDAVPSTKKVLSGLFSAVVNPSEFFSGVILNLRAPQRDPQDPYIEHFESEHW